MLYDRLDTLIKRGPRTIARATALGILPRDTLYFDRELAFNSRHPGDRSEVRKAWLDGALAATKDADIIFADPDNGLEIKTGSTAAKGPKYAFFAELKSFWERDQSLIVYQHTSRVGTAADQLKRRFTEIREYFGVEASALWFRRVSPRFFFVIPRNEHHTRILKAQSRAFVAGPWGAHFMELVPH